MWYKHAVEITIVHLENPGLKVVLDEVIKARSRYIRLAKKIDERHAQYRPAPDAWNAVEITEHLYWAEQSDLWGMWQAWQAHQNGTPVWTGEHTNWDLSIEEIVMATWQPKEQALANALPRMGGTLAFWYASLWSLHSALITFARTVQHADLEAIIYPHPISGPLDVRQQFEFIRFHIDRHRRQLGALFPHIEAKR